MGNRNEEVWVAVTKPDFPVNKFGHTYEVSNYGRVRNKTKDKILSGRINKDGYWTVNLAGKDYKVHRLVAFNFLWDSYEDDMTVNHKDFNKSNNAVDNLEWVTRIANFRHAYENGRMINKSGENNGNNKLSWDKVREIRASKLSKSELSVIYKVSYQQIDKILKNRAWVI